MPILLLQGLEGRMFRPMAITVCTALAGSLILALTLVPALASISFARHVPRAQRGGSEGDWGARAAAACTGVLASLWYIGTEFMPRLDEGSMLVETRKLPGVSLTESVEISKVIEKRLRQFQEIADVVIKIGRPCASMKLYPA